MKKVTLRKDIVSNEMLPKEDLLRIVKSKDGEVTLDLTQKKDGRGAYIKKDLESLELLKKRKLLNKAFKGEVNPSIYLEIEKYIKEGK